MNPIDLILYALATFRVALMFSKEQGPCNVFDGVRQCIEGKARCLTQGIHCLWCWSIWVGSFFAGYYWLMGRADFFIAMLAFSAVAVILNQAFTQHEGK